MAVAVLALWKGGDDTSGNDTGWERRISLAILPSMYAGKVDFRLIYQNPLAIICIVLQLFYMGFRPAQPKLENGR